MIAENEQHIPYVLFIARKLRGYDVTVFLELVLHELGFSLRGYGRDYLKEAVKVYCVDPGQLLVDGIYQQVARKTGPGCNKYQVEVTIRRAVHSAWKHRDATVWRLFFPGCEEAWEKPPSNSHFITALATLVQLWENEHNKDCAKEVSAGEKNAEQAMGCKGNDG